MPDSRQKKIKVHLTALDPALQEEIKAMPIADREKFLDENGLDDSTWGLIKSTWNQLGEKQAHDFPYPSLNELPYDPIKQEITNPELINTQAKAAAGMIPMMLGGAGPVATAIGAGINTRYGPDPSSSEGIAALLANMGFAKYLPMGASTVGNIAKGLGQGMVTNTATGAVDLARGNEGSLNPLQNPFSLAVQGLAPAAISRVGSAFPAALEKAPPAVREKLLSLMGGLKPPTIDVPEGQLPQIPQPTITQAPPKLDPKLVNQMAKASKMNTVLRNAGATPEAMDLMTDAHWRQLEKEAGVSISSPETRALTIKMLRGDAETPIPASVAPAAPAVKESLTTAPNASIDDLYKSATSSQPLLKSGIKGADKQALEGLMARQMPDGTMVPRQPSEYIADLVDSSDWSSLPKVMEKMDTIYPNGEFKKAVQDKIVQSVVTGIGSEGPLGDLSILKRIKTFHDAPVGGGQKGRDVLKSVFDGSTEAASNLETMHDIVQGSLDAAREGKNFLGFKVFPGNVRKTLASATDDLGMGAGLGSVVSFIFPTALLGGAAGTAAAAATGYKVFTMGTDKLADMMARKNTKWASTLYDLMQGSSAHSAGTINNILSGIRARSIHEETIGPDEMQQIYNEWGNQ